MTRSRPVVNVIWRRLADDVMRCPTCKMNCNPRHPGQDGEKVCKHYVATVPAAEVTLLDPGYEYDLIAQAGINQPLVRDRWHCFRVRLRER